MSDGRPTLWIGGGSGAGKSTIARRLATRLGFTLVGTDASMRRHADRLAPSDAPLLDAFTRMSMNERWVERTPAEMLATFHWFTGEGFDLIVDDVRSAAGAAVVVEGFRLLPDLVAPLLDEHDAAVWLLPTPAFRRAAFDARGSTWEIAGQTSDPEHALANLLERDHLFTERLRRDVERLGLAAIDVDGSESAASITDQIEGMLR